MFANWIANKYSGRIMKQVCECSLSILEFNYSLLKQKLGHKSKLKNIINKSEVQEENKPSDNEFHVMMKNLSQFVRLFRIHYIDLTKIDDNELLNQIMMEYYMAKKKNTGYKNK